METIVIANLIVFMIISTMVVFIGLDLKKWTSWLYGLYGLISGFLLGLLYANALGGFGLGILFGFAVMYSSAMTRWHKQRFK